jgi:hypothetical protein
LSVETTSSRWCYIAGERETSPACKEWAELHAANGTNRIGYDASDAQAIGARAIGEAAGEPNGHEAGHNPPSLWSVIVRWAIRGTLAAFLISLIIHIVGLVIAGLIVLGDGRGGASPAGAPEPVGFAVMTEGELAELQAAGLVAETPTVPEIDSGPTAVDQSLEDESIAQAGEGTVSELSNLGGATGGGEISGDGLGGVGGSGGGGGASFFGVEAQGSRFAFVVDVSGSMSVGGKLEALRSSLLETIAGFNDASSFLIVPYSTEALPLGGKRSWTDSTTSGKRWARQLIGKLEADGATNPGPAFQIVFAQRPRPDAVYFMTDGEFDPQVADDLKVLNSELRIPIHCITLETRDSEELMKRIAAESKGTYTFVPGTGGRTP